MTDDSRLDLAFASACAAGALLMLAGVQVYVPVAHCHAITCSQGGYLIGEQAWLAHGRLVMPYCAGMIRCRLPGWDRSSGMKAEAAFFERLGRPVIDMEPGLVPAEFLEGGAHAPR